MAASVKLLFSVTALERPLTPFALVLEVTKAKLPLEPAFTITTWLPLATALLAVAFEL